MFNTVVGTCVEATEESIHAAMERKFSQFKPTSKGHGVNEGRGNAKMESMRKTITNLERKLFGHEEGGRQKGGRTKQ